MENKLPWRNPHPCSKNRPQRNPATYPDGRIEHFQNAGVVNKLPTGAIIGKANLVDCFQIDEAYRRKLQRENPAELAFGDYTIGRYAWVMADAILFNKPIPAKGKQGLWNWEGGIQDGQ